MRKQASVVLAAVGVAVAAALFGGVLGGNRAEGTVTHADPCGGGPARRRASPRRRHEGVRRRSSSSGWRAVRGDAAGPHAPRLATSSAARRDRAIPSYYPRSEEALERSLAASPANDLALTGLAASRRLQASFRRTPARWRRGPSLSTRGARGLRRPRRLAGRAGPLQRGHSRASTRMASLKPALASYSRVSYARELLGRPRAAIVAMKLAVEAGRGDGGTRRVGARSAREPLLRHGPAHFGGAELPRGARALSRLRAREAALGRVAAAHGRYDVAARLSGRAVAKLPLPQYESSLGDVLTLAGRDAAADNAYAVVDATGSSCRRTESGRNSRPLSSISTTARRRRRARPCGRRLPRAQVDRRRRRSRLGVLPRTGAAGTHSRIRGARSDSGRMTPSRSSTAG
jgi:hypothetical protein